MNYKSLKHSVDKAYYDKAYKLLNTRQGKRKMRLRKKTVEPIWGTLLSFRKLKKVYTKGNDLANKQVLMAAAAYNLKKLMGFSSLKFAANVMKNIVANLKTSVFDPIWLFHDFIFCILSCQTINKTKIKIYYCS